MNESQKIKKIPKKLKNPKKVMHAPTLLKIKNLLPFFEAIFNIESEFFKHFAKFKKF